MPRRDVEFRAGEYYHVYNRGVNRQPIFFDRGNYLFFLTKLREFVVAVRAESTPAAASSRGADVIAYCLMPNHFHLLVRLQGNEFSRGMQSFGQSYTNAINKAQSRSGPLFQGRFRAKHVDDEAYLLHLSRYIHLNPVAAALIKRPQDWEFSSYQEYIGLRGGTLPQPGIVLSQFESQASYRRFVEGANGREDPTIEHLLFNED